MKKLNVLIIILAFLPLFSFSQDYWEHITSNDTSGIISLAVAKDGTIYYGSEKGLFISQDDGLTWNFKFLLNYIWVTSIEFDVDSNLLVGASYKLYKYFIEKDSFSYIQTPSPISDFMTIFVDSVAIYTNSDLNQIKRFQEGEWTNLDLGNDAGSVYSLAKDTNDVLYAGTTGFDYGGGVFRSFDNGDNWEYFGLHHYYVRSIAIDSYNRLYAGAIGHVTTSEGGFFRYNYETLQWDTISHNARVQSLFFNEEDSLYAGIYSQGGNAGAWMSPDYGDTWIKISSGLPTTTSSNVDNITEDSNGYLYAIVGEQKSIYKSSDSTITSIEYPTNQNIIEFEVYPNPFTESFRIDLNEKLHNDQLTIHLYDILGREQKIIVDELENGCFRIQMKDIKTSGIYLLKVQSDAKIYSQKIFKY